MHKIGIIGLGYVGLPLAHAFAEKYNVVGIDKDHKRIEELKKGIDSTFELNSSDLKSVSKNLEFVKSIEEASDCNIYIVTVPTPIDDNNQPDLGPLISASQAIGSVISPGNIVIYESTVYPGVTEDVCVPEIEKISGYKYNKEFFCGYSPERINPGDKSHTVKNILKVTSGSTSEIATVVNRLYLSVIDAGTYLAPSIKVAEASKVIENTQRDVNIALINELAIIFDAMDIDTSAVIAAASTKWNFINLNPGLVGGHCIGVDPYYLTFQAEKLGYKPNLILSARQINNGMGKYIAEKTIKLMISNDLKIKNSNILVLGMTFKEDCPDLRNTKVVDIINELESYETNVNVFDPWVKLDNKGLYEDLNWVSDPFSGDMQKYDAVILAVAHREFKDLVTNDFEKIIRSDSVLVDVKSVLKNATWRL